ncbi:MAG: S41 family peptidase [Candidatus Sulfotelmatobacter sp.]
MTEQTQRQAIISRVKNLVLKHHFNIEKIDYAEWCREVDEQSAILSAADDGIFEEGIRALLAKLKSSHTNFYTADVNSTKPQHVIGATLRSVSDSGRSHWMFLDVFEDGPAARAGAAPGQLLVSVDGAPAIPPVFPAFRFGQDHYITTKLPRQPETSALVITVPQKKTRKGRPPLIEPKSVRHCMLTQRIGLLKVPFFLGSFGIRFSNLLNAAVEDLKAKGCDRLIIDLRGCLGGSLGFATLVSYLCADQIPIGYDVTRKRLQRGYAACELPRVPMPRTKAGVLFCLARFSVQDKSLMLLTQGMGPQPFHGHIVILVNEFTSSAGEMAAQFAKDTKLATLVGQKTMGNVLGSTTFSVGNGYILYIPIIGWYGPKGNHTEGSGVEPDVLVDIDPEALARGSDAQLNTAFDVLQ